MSTRRSRQGDAGLLSVIADQSAIKDKRGGRVGDEMSGWVDLKIEEIWVQQSRYMYTADIVVTDKR